MPEIKNTFLQGKMNKDLDERLVPNGQYRDAVNIEVSTAEGSDVGVAKNILGNYKVESYVDPNFTCVGSIENEKTNKIYWFVSTSNATSGEENVDAILEYDVVNDVPSWILVDKYAGTHKAVLKFSGNIITGINIIDNLLFWTDNNSEPKKINIDTCKEGTDQSGNEHTQLSFENGSFDGMTINRVGGDMGTTYNSRYFWFQTAKFLKVINTWEHFPQDSTNDTVMRSAKIRHYRDDKFLGSYKLNFLNTTNWPSDDNDPIIENRYTVDSINYVESTTFSQPGVIPFEDGTYPEHGTLARKAAYIDTALGDWKVGDIIFSDGITLDIEERHITVIKPKP